MQTFVLFTCYSLLKLPSNRWLVCIHELIFLIQTTHKECINFVDKIFNFIVDLTLKIYYLAHQKIAKSLPYAHWIFKEKYVRYFAISS